jgi:hypothetical protein
VLDAENDIGQQDGDYHPHHRQTHLRLLQVLRHRAHVQGQDHQGAVQRRRRSPSVYALKVKNYIYPHVQKINIADNLRGYYLLTLYEHILTYKLVLRAIYGIVTSLKRDY